MGVFGLYTVGGSFSETDWIGLAHCSSWIQMHQIQCSHAPRLCCMRNASSRNPLGRILTSAAERDCMLPHVFVTSKSYNCINWFEYAESEGETLRLHGISFKLLILHSRPQDLLACCAIR